MPLVNFEITDMNNCLFHKSDRAIVSSKNYETRIKNFFSHTDIPISVTIGSNKSKFEDGVFNIWIPNNLTATYNALTPWIVAHRALHEMSHFHNMFHDVNFINNELQKILNIKHYSLYPSQNVLQETMRFLLTSKVGRECKRVSFADIYSELFAQFLNGGIKLLRQKDWNNKIDYSQSLKGNKYKVLSLAMGKECYVDQESFISYDHSIINNLTDEKIDELETFLTEYFSNFIQTKIAENFAKNYHCNKFANQKLYV